MPVINVRGQGGGAAAPPGLDAQRIKFSADESARMEFRLRKFLNDYSMREEKRLEDEKLRNIKQANREAVLAERQLARDRLRSEREAKRDEMRLKRDADRAAIREEREATQKSRTFWRDLSIGGIVGSIGGGRGFSGFSRELGGTFGGAMAGLAGAGRFEAGLIADIVAEVAGFAANPLGAVGGAAQPAYGFQNRAFALARAAGRSGRGFETTFMPGVYGRSAYGPNVGAVAPGWMQQLGLTPEMGVQSLEQFGIPVQGDVGKFSQAMRLLSLQRGMSNLPAGSAEAMTRQLTGMGLQAPTAGSLAGENTRALLTVLTEANTKGLDNSKLLAAMASSLNVIERSGAATASTSAMRDLMRMGMGFGTPGGVTGANAAASAEGVAANFSHILRNPMMTMALMQYAEAHGGLRSEASVRSLIGDDMYRSLAARPGGRAIIASAIQAGQQGQVAAAINLLSQFQAITPLRSGQIALPFAQTFTGGLTAVQPTVLQGMTGMHIGDAGALAFGFGPGGGNAQRGLQRSPLTEQKAAAFIKAMFGVAPSSGQRSLKDNMRVGGAANSMHISGEAADIRIVPGMTPDQMINKIKSSGVPYSELFYEDKPGHRPHIHWGWRPKMGRGGKPLGNIPMSGIPLGAGGGPGGPNVGIQTANQLNLPPSFGDQVKIAVSNLNEAYLTAATLVKVMGSFNDGLVSAVNNLGNFNKMLGKITGGMTGRGQVLNNTAIGSPHLR